MSTISSANAPVAAARDAALAILRSMNNTKESEEQQQVWDMRSDNADAIAAIGDAFSASTKFAADYNKLLDSMDERYPGITKENAQANATIEAIIENRELFPPEEFTLRFEFTGGGAIESTIPALKMVNAMKFAERNAEKEAQYLDAQAAEAAGPDPAAEALKAQGQALRTLLLDSSAVGSALLSGDEKADEEALARPFLSESADA